MTCSLCDKDGMVDGWLGVGIKVPCKCTKERPIVPYEMPAPTVKLSLKERAAGIADNKARLLPSDSLRGLDTDSRQMRAARMRYTPPPKSLDALIVLRLLNSFGQSAALKACGWVWAPSSRKGYTGLVGGWIDPLNPDNESSSISVAYKVERERAFEREEQRNNE